MLVLLTQEEAEVMAEEALEVQEEVTEVLAEAMAAIEAAEVTDTADTVIADMVTDIPVEDLSAPVADLLLWVL